MARHNAAKLREILKAGGKSCSVLGTSDTSLIGFKTNHLIETAKMRNFTRFVLCYQRPAICKESVRI